MFTISGYPFRDFTFAGSDGTPFTISTAENGPFPVPGGAAATATGTPI